LKSIHSPKARDFHFCKEWLLWKFSDA